MKPYIKKILIFTLAFFSLIKTSDAFDVLCKYEDSGNNEISIEYDNELEQYYFGYNFEEYGKLVKVSSIKSGGIGYSVFEPALYLDENSANYLKDKNNIKCPSYAFWDKDEKDFCFSNDSNGCSNISGHNFNRFNKTTDYVSNKVETILTCGAISSGSSYKAGDTSFTISIDSQKGVNISYSTDKNNWQKLSSSADYVTVKSNTGLETSAFFWNNNLSEPISNRNEFNNLYYELSENGTKCPDLKFSYFTGNYYVYLENSFDDDVLVGEQEIDKPDTNDDTPDVIDPGFEFDVNDCESYLGDPDTDGTPAHYLKFAFNLIKYLAIVLLLVLTIIEFAKAITSSNQDAMKKAIQTSIKRLLIAVIIFFTPILIMFLLELFGIVGASTCGVA